MPPCGGACRSRPRARAYRALGRSGVRRAPEHRPRGRRHRGVRRRLLLGRRGRVRARQRGAVRRLGLRRRHCSLPHLRAGELGYHRPRRVGARGLRSRRGELRAAAQCVLHRRARSHRVESPGTRCRHPVPLDRLLPQRGAAPRDGRLCGRTDEREDLLEADRHRDRSVAGFLPRGGLPSWSTTLRSWCGSGGNSRRCTGPASARRAPGCVPAPDGAS
jgi:hypothetical protein